MNNLTRYDIRGIAGIRTRGRFDPEQSALPMHWTAGGFDLYLNCTALSVEIEAHFSAQTPWLALFIDGAPVSRMPLEEGTHTYALVSGLETDRPHIFSVLRDTQPLADGGIISVTAHAVYTDGEPLTPPAHRLRIECIGDSLTTGEGLVGAVGEMSWRTAWLSGINGWPMQTAAALDADLSIVSQSGWGVYCEWTGSEQAAIPRIYDQICAHEAAGQKPYDFAAHPVDAVIVNLGTNDATGIRSRAEADQPKSIEEYGRAVEGFIRHLRAVYPGAYILWIYGMCGHDLIDTVRAAVARVRRTDKRVGFETLPPAAAHELGSRAHPGVPSQTKAARIVVRHLQKHLGQ